MFQFAPKLPAPIANFKAVVREPIGAAMGHATLLLLAAIVVTQSVSEIAGMGAGVVLSATEAQEGKCVMEAHGGKCVIPLGVVLRIAVVPLGPAEHVSR
jgi:hypothetical protein